jgi:hypothetical protein
VGGLSISDDVEGSVNGEGEPPGFSDHGAADILEA